MLNSSSLDRSGTLDLVVANGGPVIVAAAGDARMPEGAQQRVDHGGRMVEAAERKGINHALLYIDRWCFFHLCR
jgi:hypothetical protein